MEQTQASLDSVSQLLKLVNERENLFFQVFNFVNNNIECSSHDIDNTSVFNHFLPPLKRSHNTLKEQQQLFLNELAQICETESTTDVPSKDIERLSSRIYERLQISMNRVRRGVFDDGGRSARELLRFKGAIQKILKKKPFILSEYGHVVIHYTNTKFNRQLSKLENYFFRVNNGQNIFLKDLFAKGSDIEASSPDEKLEKKEKKLSTFKKQPPNFKVEGKSQHIEEDKRGRRLKSTVKKRQKLQPTRHKPKGSDSEDDKPNKQQTANKLYNFYESLKLNRKQFLEDYIFKETEKEKHKVELYNRLQERNRGIKSQISNFVKNRPNMSPVSTILMPPAYFSRSSGDQYEPITLKQPKKHEFRLTRRRGSVHFESSSGAEKNSDIEKDLPHSTSKKWEPQRKSTSQNKSRPRPQQKNRKLMVVKQAKQFDGDLIPQAQFHEPHISQLPKSLRSDRRNDLRYKRQNNNPSRLQNANLSEHFRYS